MPQIRYDFPERDAWRSPIGLNKVECPLSSLQSITVAEAAKSLDDSLTPQEVKAIARKVVNKEDIKLSAKALSAFSGVLRGGKALLTKAATKVIPKVIPVLSVIGIGSAIKTGYAGEGGSGHDGVTGATLEAYRDFMVADVMEGFVFSHIPGAVNDTTNALGWDIDGAAKQRAMRMQQQGDGYRK